MDLGAIRRGIAENLKRLPDTQVSAYPLGNPTPPTLQVLGPVVEYDKALHRGMDEWVFIVQGMFALGTDFGGYETMDKYFAPSGRYSVKQAIEYADDPDGGRVTLGGVVDDLHVRRGRANERAVLATSGADILVAEWEIVLQVEGA